LYLEINLLKGLENIKNPPQNLRKTIIKIKNIKAKVGVDKHHLVSYIKGYER